jgi:hypothetical protein
MIQRSTGKGTWLQLARTLPASARVMGLYMLAYRGSGKSRMLGRMIAMQDFLAGRPQVIIDAIGGTIDDFLDKFLRFLQHLPKSEHRAFWERIVYIDMAGRDGFITPFPLYFRLGTETSLLEISERYLQVIIKSNPALYQAQVLGWPPLHRIGVNTGMVLAALGYQITEAEDLLHHSENARLSCWIFAMSKMKRCSGSSCCGSSRISTSGSKPGSKRAVWGNH